MAKNECKERPRTKQRTHVQNFHLHFHIIFSYRNSQKKKNCKALDGCELMTLHLNDLHCNFLALLHSYLCQFIRLDIFSLLISIVIWTTRIQFLLSLTYFSVSWLFIIFVYHAKVDTCGICLATHFFQSFFLLLFDCFYSWRRWIVASETISDGVLVRECKCNNNYNVSGRAEFKSRFAAAFDNGWRQRKNDKTKTTTEKKKHWIEIMGIKTETKRNKKSTERNT